MFSKNKKKWKISCTFIISNLKYLKFFNKKNIQLFDMNIVEEQNLLSFEPTAPLMPPIKKIF
jgi:hypothetical protein